MARSRRQQPRHDEQMRRLLAQDSARLIVEHGIENRRHALRKAASRLGAADEASWPQLEEIEEAVRERQRLFGGTAQADVVQQRRRVALEAMRFLHAFQPRLVGAVLDGTADRHTPVQLQLFSDDPDAPTRFLQEQRIPHTSASRRLHFERDDHRSFPMHGFNADGIDFELTVLPLDGLRQAPLDASCERPQARASLAALQLLIEREPRA